MSPGQSVSLGSSLWCESGFIPIATPMRRDSLARCLCLLWIQKVAVSNHGAALTGTDNVPEAHGEPPHPPRAFSEAR